MCPTWWGPVNPSPSRPLTTAWGPCIIHNQQSARLLFYHDHASGITRLNVYAGLAAPYLITSQVEDDMIDGTNVSGAFTAPKKVLPNLGGVYRYGIPLVIQDKNFVNDTTTAATATANGVPAANQSPAYPGGGPALVPICPGLSAGRREPLVAPRVYAQ